MVFAVDPLAGQTKIVPDDTWVNLYFEEIDQFSEQMGLKPLRTIALEPGDLELRVWKGFGIAGSNGYAVSRVRGKWSANAMVQLPYQQAHFNKVPHSTDWANMWADLQRGGIADIRDDSEIPKCTQVLDGVSYVVEIARAGFYRTYMVRNPQSVRSEDGDKFLHLLP